MTSNEVAVGVPLYTFLGQLVVMERNATRRGEPFHFTFATEPDVYDSTFGMAGLEYLMGFFMKECPPPDKCVGGQQSACGGHLMGCR